MAGLEPWLVETLPPAASQVTKKHKKSFGDGGCRITASRIEYVIPYVLTRDLLTLPPLLFLSPADVHIASISR